MHRLMVGRHIYLSCLESTQNDWQKNIFRKEEGESNYDSKVVEAIAVMMIKWW